MADEDYFVDSLTEEEIQTLDMQAAQMLMGKLDGILCKLQRELARATQEYGTARMKMQTFKTYKDIIVERMRNLKNFCKSGGY